MLKPVRTARCAALLVAGVLALAGLLAESGAFAPPRADAQGNCHLNPRGGRAALDAGAAAAQSAGATAAQSAGATSAPGARQPPTPTTPNSTKPPNNAGGFELTVPRAAAGRLVPPGFLGLSFEYRAIQAYAGQDPEAINPVFVQLIRNLTPGQAPMIRIAGDSTDWTWWPVPGMSRPPGVSYEITTPWLEVTRSLVTALGAHLILGINLEADSARLATAEAQALTNGIGADSISAFEPGNEPELYRSWGWYCSPDGREVTGRPASYGFSAFTRDFSRFAHALPGPLAGPTIGIVTWFPNLPRFLDAEPRVRIVTLHRYPLQNYVRPSSPKAPTISHLLADVASRGLADSVAPYIRAAHARHVPLRVDEMNNVSAGAAPGVADAFASALWMTDALFSMASVGVDGVNVHTFPGATYELFRFKQVEGRWEGFVGPEYYGLLLFAQATPPHSRVIALSTPAGGPVRAWVTRAPDGTVRVVLINDGDTKRRLTIKVPGTSNAATLELLRAPGLHATSGVTLGGQSFGSETETGLLDGPSTTVSVKPSKARYRVELPPTSEALLTIPRR